MKGIPSELRGARRDKKIEKKRLHKKKRTEARDMITTADESFGGVAEDNDAKV